MNLGEPSLTPPDFWTDDLAEQELRETWDAGFWAVCESAHLTDDEIVSGLNQQWDRDREPDDCAEEWVDTCYDRRQA